MFGRKKKKKAKYGVLKTNTDMERISKENKKTTKKPIQSEDAWVDEK